jgi:hypothetical protein
MKLTSAYFFVEKPKNYQSGPAVLYNVIITICLSDPNSKRIDTPELKMKKGLIRRVC